MIGAVRPVEELEVHGLIYYNSSVVRETLEYQLVAPPVVPVLHPQFRPAILALRSFGAQVRKSGKPQLVRIALASRPAARRNGGKEDTQIRTQPGKRAIVCAAAPGRHSPPCRDTALAICSCVAAPRSLGGIPFSIGAHSHA